MDDRFVERVEECWSSISSRLPRVSSVGVVLGSGLQDFGAAISGVEIPYSEIRGFPSATVAGHRGAMKVGGGVAVCMGRFHVYEGHDVDDVVLPVFLLRRMGVETLVITNAAGGINREFRPGDLVLIRDHLNFMGVNPLRGRNVDSLGTRFPDMSAAYPAELRDVARRAQPGLREGVYAALAGPSYETPAEIRMLRTLGADMVGMSTVPEVIAAVYSGMRVLGVSCITNMAAGILDQPLDHDEVLETGRRVAARVIDLLSAVVGICR